MSCGKPAQLCIVIRVKECFFHCSRAFNRSHVWTVDKWPTQEATHFRDQLADRKKISAEDVENNRKKILMELGESDGAY